MNWLRGFIASAVAPILVSLPNQGRMRQIAFGKSTNGRPFPRRALRNVHKTVLLQAGYERSDRFLPAREASVRRCLNGDISRPKSFSCASAGTGVSLAFFPPLLHVSRTLSDAIGVGESPTTARKCSRRVRKPEAVLGCCPMSPIPRRSWRSCTNALAMDPWTQWRRQSVARWSAPGTRRPAEPPRRRFAPYTSPLRRAGMSNHA